MSLPIITGAGLYKYFDIGGFSGVPSDLRVAFVVGMAAAAVTGFVAVWGLLRLVVRVSFGGFAIYRVAAAVGVLAVLALR
jgi:undecaprenyl-diphosphatase